MLIITKINQESPSTINPGDTKLAYRKVKLLLKPWARSLMYIMAKYGEMNVTEILIQYCREYGHNTEHSQICIWLNYLKGVGVVKNRREGKWIYYDLDTKEIGAINKISRQLSKFYLGRINGFSKDSILKLEMNHGASE